MLETKLCGFTLKNPIIAASGTFGFGAEYAKLFDVSKLGGISSKGLTLHEKQGNNGVRMMETPAGMLNSVGLQNPGVQGFIDHELPGMRKLGPLVIANLGGGTEEDYLEGARLLDAADVDIIELNISCPNVKSGGMAFGIEANVAHDLVKKVRAVVRKKPLMVKLSPNARNIKEMAKACEEAGADSLSLINTLQAMAVDIYKKAPVFKNVTAGLSGPAVKPVALRMVYEVCQTVNIPVVGLGGIATWEDVIEFIMVGATAVQVGTAQFAKPDLTLDLIDGVTKYLQNEGYSSLDEIRGVIA